MHYMRYWTCHWHNRFWRSVVNSAGNPLGSSGINILSRRVVAPGRRGLHRFNSRWGIAARRPDDHRIVSELY